MISKPPNSYLRKRKSKRTPSDKPEFHFQGPGGRVLIRDLITRVSEELEIRPTYQVPLCPGGDDDLRAKMLPPHVKNRLLAFIKESALSVVNDQGIPIAYTGTAEESKTCYLTSIGAEKFIAAFGWNATVMVAETFKKLTPTPCLNTSPKECWGVIKPIHIPYQPKPVEAEKPIDFAMEIYHLRKLQNSLKSLQNPDPEDDYWGEEIHQMELIGTESALKSAILRLSRKLPGRVPSKGISRLAVELAWITYLESRQPPDAGNVLVRMHELAKQDVGHECLLMAILTKDGQKTVSYQGGEKRHIYKKQACYRTLKDWWDSYTEILG